MGLPLFAKIGIISGWSCFPIKKKAKKMWMAALLSLIGLFGEREIELFLRIWFSP